MGHFGKTFFLLITNVHIFWRPGDPTYETDNHDQILQTMVYNIIAFRWKINLVDNNL